MISFYLAELENLPSATIMIRPPVYSDAYLTTFTESQGAGTAQWVEHPNSNLKTLASRGPSPDGAG